MSQALDPADFDGRYAMCPLCRRDNVRLSLREDRVVFDEHPVPMIVAAHPAPVDTGLRFDPRELDPTWTTIAHVRCPVSLSPLMVLEIT